MINENIEKLLSFMKPRGNPFQITEEGVKLKNMVTQVASDPNVSRRLLNIFSEASASYNEFHKQVYIDETLLLNDKIRKLKYPQLDDVPPAKASITANKQKTKRSYRQHLRLL